MGSSLSLQDVINAASALSPWAHLATVGSAEVGDGVEVWGTAELFTDLETKRRLWNGVFDYDLNAFAPGGPDDSPDTGFLAVSPTRAMVMKQYGMGGVERWRA